MGSFAGHIDEACFFLAVTFWWIFNNFPKHITGTWADTPWKSVYSYPLYAGHKRLLVEQTIKILFPFAGLLAEVIAADGTFIDEDGNFDSLVNMQHITIYAMFILHGVVDLLMHMDMPLPAGMEYVTAAAAFAWYGLGFSYHAHMEGKQPLESMVHELPTYVMYVLSVVLIVEWWQPQSFLPVFARMYTLLVLGTWFFHVSFILYVPTPFPGRDHNPSWDHSEPRNVHALVAIFGYHLLFDLAFLVMGYLATAMALRWRQHDRVEFKPLINDDSDSEETLLSKV